MLTSAVCRSVLRHAGATRRPRALFPLLQCAQPACHRGAVRSCTAIAGNESTAFALATSPGKSAIAVVRVSGPQAKAVLHSVTSPIETAGNSAGLLEPVPRLMKFQKVYCPSTGRCLDHAMTAWFPGPNSYTGEDMLELHLHGGRAVVQAVLRSLATIPVRARSPCRKPRCVAVAAVLTAG